MKDASKKQWKIIGLSSLGGGLEYYDFVIFIVFAQYIGKNFSYSGTENKITQLFFALSLFAVGYLARPIGGIFFSHLGDKFGRKKAFSLSITTMALSTLCMGLLPSYHSIGITATILFTVLRIIQGVSLGGELPGAITFLKEHCHKNVGMACGILYFFVNTGILLADGMNALLSHFFSFDMMMQWGWRIAFFVGSSLAILAYFLRQRLEETPDFLELQGNTKKVPFLSLISQHSGRILVGLLAFSLAPLSITMILLYITSYLAILPNPESNLQISNIAVINALIVSASIPLFGKIADKLGKRFVLIFSALAFLILSPILFHQVVAGKTNHIYWSLGILSIFVGSAILSSVVFLSEIFPTDVRYSGIAFCYNISFAIFGGLSPLVASFLINQHNLLIAPAYLLQFAAALTLIGIWGYSRAQKTRTMQIISSNSNNSACEVK